MCFGAVFEVLTASLMNIQMLLYWACPKCRVMNCNRRCGEEYCLLPYDQRSRKRVYILFTTSSYTNYWKNRESLITVCGYNKSFVFAWKSTHESDKTVTAKRGLTRFLQISHYELTK